MRCAQSVVAQEENYQKLNGRRCFGICTTTGLVNIYAYMTEFMPFINSMSRQGVDLINLAYNLSRPNNRLKLTACTFNQYACTSSPGNRDLCFKGQDLPFLSQQWLKSSSVFIAPSHRGKARLNGTGKILEWYTRQNGRNQLPGSA